MGRVVTIHQRNANVRVFAHKAAKGGKNCAHCRNSESRVIAGVCRFVCRLSHVVMEAAACPDFKDARENLCGNYLTLR